MASLHVLRVFTSPGGEHGNELGVFLDGADVPEPERQDVARDLGFSETVFVDDTERGEIRIHTPEVELPFAGHPSVGTAWLLQREGIGVATLRPPAGELRVRRDGELIWIAAKAEWSPPFDYPQLESAAEVDALQVDQDGEGWTYAWAWEDEAEGRIRSRSFVTEAGIGEDEATGSAALTLCARLGRPIQIRQGRGSEIHARPLSGGFTEVGGRCILDGTRDYRLG